MTLREQIARLDLSRPIALELGCGGRKQSSEALGVDIASRPGVDLVGDALEVLRLLPEASVKEVSSWHFLEHVEHPGELLAEIARVLTNDGRLNTTVPHFSNPYFYSDPTHRTTWGIYTMSYWIHDPIHRRQVPKYSDPLPLELIDVRLGFKADRAFPARYVVRRAYGSLIGWSRWLRELHEDVLSWLFPVYEVTYRARRLPR